MTREFGPNGCFSAMLRAEASIKVFRAFLPAMSGASVDEFWAGYL